MAKSEYICKSCRKVKTAGLLGHKNRYKCPSHGFICGSCVKLGLLKNKCKECNSKVVKYSWNENKGKWLNS